MKSIKTERPLADKVSSKDKQALVLFLLACSLLVLPLLQRQSSPPSQVYAVERMKDTEQGQVVSIPFNDIRSQQEGTDSFRLNSQQSSVSIFLSGTHKDCSLQSELALFFGCPLPINKSRLEELVMLPGIGPQRAALLLAARQKKGHLQGAEDLLAIPGIGPATVQRLLPLISFE